MGRWSVLPVTEENENGIQASYHCKLWEAAKTEYSNCWQRCRTKGTFIHHQQKYSLAEMHTQWEGSWHEQLKRKRFLWLTVSEFHHSQGLCCPYTCGEVMHDGEKLLTSWQPGNRDREEGARDDIHPSKSYSQWPAPSNHALPSSSPLNYEVINDLVPLMKSELLGSNHVLKAHHLTMEPLRLLRTF